MSPTCWASSASPAERRRREPPHTWGCTPKPDQRLGTEPTAAGPRLAASTPVWTLDRIPEQTVHLILWLMPPRLHRLHPPMARTPRPPADGTQPNPVIPQQTPTFLKTDGA